MDGSGNLTRWGVARIPNWLLNLLFVYVGEPDKVGRCNCEPKMAQRAPAVGATKNVTIFVQCKSQFRKIVVDFDFEESHKTLVTRASQEKRSS